MLEGYITDESVAIDTPHIEARDQAPAKQEKEKPEPQKRDRKSKEEREAWLKQKQEEEEQKPLDLFIWRIIMNNIPSNRVKMPTAFEEEIINLKCRCFIVFHVTFRRSSLGVIYLLQMIQVSGPL